LVIALSLLIFSGPLAAESAGTIKTTRGDVEILRGSQMLPAAVGLNVEESDTIKTGASGIVGITLNDNTRLTAGPDSILELRRFVFDTTTHKGSLDASVRRGSVAVISGKIAKANPDAVSFSTPTVTLGVRGTHFIIEAAGEQTLDRAFATVDVDEEGSLSARTESEASVGSKFGKLLDATPQPPRSFVVTFESGSADQLTAQSRITLEEMRSHLRARPAPEILVIGHTDRVGSDEDNDILSKSRADTVL
jgi:outer membrane protein OmpA-like peptidoglycan-associated protein